MYGNALQLHVVIGSFKSKALGELWSRKTTAKIDSKMHSRILRRLDQLDEANDPEDMNIPGFNFHALRGFDPTRYTVHVNGPWYITFAFDGANAVDVDFEQYH
jgi:proteic killer suppression protein